MLALRLGAQARQRGDAHLHLGLRPIQRGAVIARVQPRQQLSGLHMLVVGNRDVGDESGDMRRDGGDVAADIGVVRGFDEAPASPPCGAGPGGSDASRDHEGAHAKAPGRGAPGWRPHGIGGRGVAGNAERGHGAVPA